MRRDPSHVRRPARLVSGAQEAYAAVMHLIAEQPVLPTDADGVGGALRRLCAAASAVLSASGVGLSVFVGDGLRGISTGSHEGTEHLEDLQFLLGEGPGIDALTVRRPVLTSHLDDAATRRWPAYTPAAYEQGVRAVFAFPLQVGAARLGVMDVFRAGAGGLSDDEVRRALLFAEAAVVILLDGQENAVDGTAGTLADQVTHTAELFQAQGMVMVQLGVSLSEALTRIRAYTYVEGRRLQDVAKDIVYGRLQLDP